LFHYDDHIVIAFLGLLVLPDIHFISYIFYIENMRAFINNTVRVIKAQPMMKIACIVQKEVVGQLPKLAGWAVPGGLFG
jgi:hypothetical protein